MKRNLTQWIVGLIILLFWANIANAGDSVSIGMSCTIPAIPGVNVPLAEGDSTRTESVSPVIQEKEAQDSPSILQDDDEGEIRLADGRTVKVEMQTLYSR